MSKRLTNSLRHIRSLRKTVDARKQAYETARALHRTHVKELATAEDRLTVVDEALQVAQHVAETIQQHAHQRIASVVTRCLEAVFPDEPYEFQLTFERKRNRTECRLSFVRNGKEEDPTGNSSGGVIDVATFALRLAALMLSRPPRRRLVVLDEPFKFVSAEYRDNVRMMLEKLAADMGVQFIMITHIEELQTGEVVRL